MQDLESVTQDLVDVMHFEKFDYEVQQIFPVSISVLFY